MKRFKGSGKLEYRSGFAVSTIEGEEVAFTNAKLVRGAPAYWQSSVIVLCYDDLAVGVVAAKSDHLCAIDLMDSRVTRTK